MNIFRRLKQLFVRQEPQSSEPIRTVPQPTRVRLADHEEGGRHFVRIPDWSSLSPAPPSWQIPALEQERLWIDGIIASHQERGSLDGFVPDLLGRDIHYRIQELECELRAAHQQALDTEQRLYLQAKTSQHAVAVELRDVRGQLARAEQGYARAYQALTWEEPARNLDEVSVEPALIPTRTSESTPGPAPSPVSPLVQPTSTGPRQESDEPAQFPDRTERHLA